MKIQSCKLDIVLSFIDIMNIITLIAMTNLDIPVIVSERIDPKYHKIPSLYSWLRIKIYPKADLLVV